MALALGVKQGQFLQVGDNRLEVVYVRGLSVGVRPVHGNAPIMLSDKERVEVLRDVFMSTARGKNDDGLTRVLIEAPRSIQITRL